MHFAIVVFHVLTKFKVSRKIYDVSNDDTYMYNTLNIIPNLGLLLWFSKNSRPNGSRQENLKPFIYLNAVTCLKSFQNGVNPKMINQLKLVNSTPVTVVV